MNEMVERAAKAMFEAWDKALMREGPLTGWENASESYRNNWRDNARAAIVEMRTPTKEMRDAGGATPVWDNIKDLAMECWHRMIDAALR